MENKKNQTIKKINTVKLACLFLIPFLWGCKSDLYSDVCDCGLKLKKTDMVSIKEDNQEGFHGDGYKIIAYQYRNLENQDLDKLRNKGFVPRSQVYIPAISELDSILSYDSTQLCFVRSEGEKFVQACIIDTSRKVILAYQLSN